MHNSSQVTIPTRRERRNALLMTFAAMIVVYILWNVPAFDFLAAPLRLFVTLVHEMSHGLAALATGGQVLGFLVSLDGSGLAVTAGGSRAIILPAGYLGAACFGSLLFVLANRLPRAANGIALLLGFSIILFVVLFARPDDQTGLPVAAFLGIGVGFLLLLAGWKLHGWLVLLVLNVLAVMTALNAVLDLWFLLNYSDAGRGAVTNDAAAFSRDILPLLPPSVIALSWALLALGMLALAIWWGVWKPLHSELNDTLDTLRS